MIVGIPVSHVDAVSAERLMWWIRFLDSKNRRSLKKTALVLCVSPMALQLPRLRIILDVADKTFGKVSTITPRHINENGWPGAPNQMFQFMVQNVCCDDDLLFVESDAAPIVPDWFQQIEEEYETKAKPARKVFMGAYVGLDQTKIPHMSGNGVYGYQCTQKAPLLMDATNVAWDVYAAPQTVPHAHWTKLIQHVFFKPAIPDDLSILKPKTVLFHQNKDGRLINLLNRKRWKGELNGGKDPVTQFEIMTKYYHADNVNRRIKVGGQQFLFEPYGQFAGVWSGVFATENDSQQAALSAAVGQRGVSVREITQEEYDSFIKKKAPDAQRLRRSQEPPGPGSLGSPVVESQKPPESADAPVTPATMMPATVEEVLMTAPVEVTPTATEPATDGRGKKTKTKLK